MRRDQQVRLLSDAVVHACACVRRPY
jgi:hypothetical protein